jgi:hypothetical protein
MAGAIVFQNFFSDSDPTKFRMYFFRTKAGVFSIVRHNDRWRLILSDRWRLIFGSDTLGSYSTAEQAVDDLAGGHFSLPSGIDPATLGIPADLSKWEQ